MTKRNPRRMISWNILLSSKWCGDPGISMDIFLEWVVISRDTPSKVRISLRICFKETHHKYFFYFFCSFLRMSISKLGACPDKIANQTVQYQSPRKHRNGAGRKHHWQFASTIHLRNRDGWVCQWFWVLGRQVGLWQRNDVPLYQKGQEKRKFKEN